MRLFVIVLLCSTSVAVAAPKKAAAPIPAPVAAPAPAPVAVPAEPQCVLPMIVNENRVKGLILPSDMHALTEDQQHGISAMLSTGNVDVSEGSDARAVLSQAFRNTTTGNNLSSLFAKADKPGACP